MTSLSAVARLAPALVLVQASAGCDEAALTAPEAGVRALFALSDDGGDFYALPFPSDIRRDDDGTISLAGYPRSNVLLGLYADAAERLDGFGLNAAIHLRFSGPIDEASLPTVEQSRDDGAAVYLVDVDPASPDRGARIPVRVAFRGTAGATIGPDWLAALPYPGFPLAEGTTYALVVTDRVTAGGQPVTAAADFAAIAGDGAVTGALADARAAYAPLWDWLDEAGGDERADVVTAAVFTTQRATAIAGALRTAVRALPAPRAANVVRVDAPDTLFSYTATFASPSFQRGEVPYRAEGSGAIVTDDDGRPVVQRSERLRLSISVPRTAMPAAGWPVALVAHGTGGDFQSYLRDGTAERMAAQGIASVSIDQVLHGPRGDGRDPAVTFFNFENPLAARDNPLQGAADGFSLLRLVEGLVVPRGSGGPAADIRFDGERIFFFGHSQGGLTGPPFVAYEPHIRGSVLSGAGGLLYYALLGKTEPIDIAALAATLLGEDTLDEWSPPLALLQTWIERSDTVNYGPLLVRRPPPGVVARPVFQSEGFVDSFTPLATIEALATAIGGDQVGPVLAPVEGLALRGRRALNAPVTANLDGTTAALVQYRAPAGEDGHFVVFDVPAAQTQSIRFLATLAATGRATVERPP
jgi:predicted esterase